MLNRARSSLGWLRGAAWIAIGFRCSTAQAQAIAEEGANTSTNVASSRDWALELNPLEVGLGRASFNLEVALAAHHALMLTLDAQPNTGDIGAGVWGELGYRFYSGAGGLQGFFIGPSIGAGTFTYFTDEVAGQQGARSINVALDCGYQFALRSGVMLGFGLGAQYQGVQHDHDVRNDPTNEVELESGVLPRVLFSIGYGG